MRTVAITAAVDGGAVLVLLLDYRGYGGNPGSPSEDGLARPSCSATVRPTHAWALHLEARAIRPSGPGRRRRG
jgi:hypothetical protein